MVSDRVLYDILIQAGRVVDLYIPRDKETDKPKGFAKIDKKVTKYYLWCLLLWEKE